MESTTHPPTHQQLSPIHYTPHLRLSQNNPSHLPPPRPLPHSLHLPLHPQAHLTKPYTHPHPLPSPPLHPRSHPHHPPHHPPHLSHSHLILLPAASTTLLTNPRILPTKPLAQIPRFSIRDPLFKTSTSPTRMDSLSEPSDLVSELGFKFQDRGIGFVTSFADVLVLGVAGGVAGGIGMVATRSVLLA